MRTQDRFYIGIPENEVDGLASLGASLHFYLWLLHGKRRFMSKSSEAFEHIGPWVKRGLVVSRFFRREYAQAAGVSERTVTNHIKALESLGRIKIVETGRKVGEDSKGTPLVAAIGIWRHVGPDDAREGFYTGWMNLLGEEHPMNPSTQTDLGRLLKIKRDLNKTDRKELAARLKEGKELPDPPSGKILPDPLELSFQTPLEESCQLIPNGLLNLTADPNGILSPLRDEDASPERVDGQDCPVATDEAHRTEMVRGQDKPRPVGVTTGGLSLMEQIKAARKAGVKTTPSPVQGESGSGMPVEVSVKSIPRQRDLEPSPVTLESPIPHSAAPLPAAPVPAGSTKAVKPKAEPKPRQRDELYDALAPEVAGGTEPAALKLAASQIGGVKKLFLAADLTADDVAPAAQFIRAKQGQYAQKALSKGAWVKYLPAFINARAAGEEKSAGQRAHRNAGTLDGKLDASLKRSW